MRSLISTLALGLMIAGSTSSQIVIREKKPSAKDVTQDASQSSSKAIGVFYKAFWLERGARKFDAAIAQYQKFLKLAPASAQAGRAARSLVNLLNRTDKIEAAKQAEKTYASLLAKKPAGSGFARGASSERRVRNARGGRDSRGGRAAGARRNVQAVVARLEKQLAAAKKDGDEETAEKLARRLKRVKENAKRQGERGGRGQAGRRGGRRGFSKPLDEMSKEEAQAWCERVEGFMERMLERLPEERAEAFEKGFKKIKALIDAGKLKEAQELRTKTMNFRRRR